MKGNKKQSKDSGPLPLHTHSHTPEPFGRKFEAIKFISRSEIPSNRRFNARNIRDIPSVREFREVLKTVSENKQINPYEIAGELDLTSPEAREIIGSRNVFPTSLRRVLRELLEEYKLTDKLMITSVDKGTRFFFVGKS